MTLAAAASLKLSEFIISTSRIYSMKNSVMHSMVRFMYSGVRSCVQIHTFNIYGSLINVIRREEVNKNSQHLF